MYFASAYATKKDSFPAQIGGVPYTPTIAWASNFRGPHRVDGESERPQWEWYDNAPGGHRVDLGPYGSPYIYGRECRAVFAGSPVPALSTKRETVWEDDECWGPFCNGDDEVGSFDVNRGYCSPDVWNRAGSPASGWSSIHQATGSGDVDWVNYRLWCYSCRNEPNTYSCSNRFQ
jgi:hypothetical protein